MLAAPARVEVAGVLRDRLTKARRHTDELFNIVKQDALYDRPIPERHRIIFYVGHVEAFDWNLLRGRLFDFNSFDASLDQLFAFGIDPVDGGLPSDQPGDWPSLIQVRRYVAQVREILDGAIQKLSAHAGSAQEDPVRQLLNVAIEHRLMHAETLAYMLHQMPLERKLPQPSPPSLFVPQIDSRMIEIPEGSATLGLARSNNLAFGWDNEYEEHETFVPSFAIDQHKVTNRQFLEFLNSGGYENRALWSDANWAWRSAQNITHPAFWRKSGQGWLQRTMFSEVPLPLDWPVYVSHAEASAYARWEGKSLSTEAQWHRAAFAVPGGSEHSYPWGNEPPASRHGNFDFQRWDPVAVGSYPAGQSAFGVREMVGNGWEWTSTVFAPFAGFEAFSFYPGYSTNFFDGQHYVIKGGSARTAACVLRPSFRNWFQPHYQYVYAGFRCVSNG